MKMGIKYTIGGQIMNIFVNKTLYLFTILFIVVLSGYVFKECFVFFMPFILAYFVAKSINPLKTFLNKKIHLPMPLSSILALTVILSIFVMVLYFIINLLVDQISSFSEDLPYLSERIYIALDSAINAIENFLNITPAVFDDMFKNIIDFSINAIGNFSKDVGKSLLNFLAFLPSLFFYTLITIIATYYISNDFEKIKKFFPDLLNRSTTLTRIRHTFKNDISFALIAYIKAQGILMIITFIIVSIGLSIMGYKYAILIALGISILDALPIFGTGTIFGPWIFIGILNADYEMALFLLIIYLVATITRQVLQPKILSTQIGINPLLTLISIYVGIRLLGVFGIVLGPIILILVTSVHKIFKNTNIIKD
jgi:sporulation integral membrane protein YtvI